MSFVNSPEVRQAAATAASIALNAAKCAALAHRAAASCVPRAKATLAFLRSQAKASRSKAQKREKLTRKLASAREKVEQGTRVVDEALVNRRKAFAQAIESGLAFKSAPAPEVFQDKPMALALISGLNRPGAPRPPVQRLRSQLSEPLQVDEDIVAELASLKARMQGEKGSKSPSQNNGGKSLSGTTHKPRLSALAKLHMAGHIVKTMNRRHFADV